MFNTASTLGELKEQIEFWIERVGADAPVGTYFRREPLPEMDGKVMMEWVCINAEGVIVGDEANDYELKLKPGERNAILFT